MLRRGRGVRDVAYFLSENLLPDVHRRIEGPLLKEYHRGLVEGGVSGYTVEDRLTDYQLALPQRFRALVSTVAVMPRNIIAILDNSA